MEQPLEQGFEPGTMFNRKRIFTPSIRTAREKKMRWGRDQQRKTHLEIKKYRNKMKNIVLFLDMCCEDRCQLPRRD